jgi:hypothetical protein
VLLYCYMTSWLVLVSSVTEKGQCFSRRAITTTSAAQVDMPSANTCLDAAVQTSYHALQYHRAGVLPFLFQHGHFSEACRLFLAHLPPPPSPPAPTPGGTAQRAVASPVDPLVSEYGSLEEVCELCVTYGAMPILEKAVQERGEARGGEWAGQHAVVLAKMAAFCETHRHFHHLYRIQVRGKPHRKPIPSVFERAHKRRRPRPLDEKARNTEERSAGAQIADTLVALDSICLRTALLHIRMERSQGPALLPMDPS